MEEITEETLLNKMKLLNKEMRTQNERQIKELTRCTDALVNDIEGRIDRLVSMMAQCISQTSTTSAQPQKSSPSPLDALMFQQIQTPDPPDFVQISFESKNVEADPVKSVGVKLAIQATCKNSDLASDVRTSVSLAQGHVNDGVNVVTAGANPVLVSRGIEETTKVHVIELKEMSKEAEDNDISDVAAVSVETYHVKLENPVQNIDDKLDSGSPSADMAMNNTQFGEPSPSSLNTVTCALPPKPPDYYYNYGDFSFERRIAETDHLENEDPVVSIGSKLVRQLPFKCNDLDDDGKMTFFVIAQVLNGEDVKVVATDDVKEKCDVDKPSRNHVKFIDNKKLLHEASISQENIIEECKNFSDNELQLQKEGDIKSKEFNDVDILVLLIDGDDEVIGVDKNEDGKVLGVEVHGELTQILKVDLQSKKEEEEKKHKEHKEEISDEDKVGRKDVLTVKEGQSAENNFYAVKDAVKFEPVSDFDFSDFVDLQQELSNWDIEAYELDEELSKDESQKRIYQWVAKAGLEITLEDFNGIAMAYDQMGTKKIFTFGRLEEDTTACSFMIHVQRSLAQNKDSISLVENGKLVLVDLDVSKHVYKSGSHLQANHLVLMVPKKVSSGILFASFVRIDSLDVERIFNEQAAALSFGMTKKEGLFVVFDPGGGTFDVSVLDIDVKRMSYWQFTKLGSAKTSPEELTPMEVNKFDRLDIDLTIIMWRKVMDVNDWLLKRITIGQSFEDKEMTGKIFVPNETIVVALTTSLSDMKKSFGKIVMDKCKVENPMTNDQSTIVVQGAYDYGLIYVTDDGQVFIYSIVENVEGSDVVLNKMLVGCNEEIGDEKLLRDEEHFLVEATNFEELWEFTWKESELILETKMLERLNKVFSKILVQWKDKPPDQVIWKFYQVLKVSSLRTRMFSTREYCYRITSSVFSIFMQFRFNILALQFRFTQTDKHVYIWVLGF